MTVGDIVLQLKYGELSNLSIKDNNEAIVTFLNAALIELYDRFSIKTSEQLIPLSDNIVDYTLAPDLMTIQAVYDENGDEFTINDETNRFSVFQVSPFTLQVANPSTGATISVVYNAAPELIQYIDDTTLNTNVLIPTQLLECLSLYIGYKAHSAVNSGLKEENNTYYLRYESSCKKILARGTIRQDVPPSQLNQHDCISEIDTLYQEIDLNT